jgi:hypothetical protein
MSTDPLAAGARPPTGRPGVALPALVVLTAAAAYVMDLVAQHTIEVVRARRLLPRWDLATHLGHGWLDYHLLVTGQVHRLVWDVWLQGYWPPGLSIYQVPFYLALGGGMTSGLWSSPVAFVLAAATGAAILLRQQRGHGGVLAASLFVSLLISSPFLLAYASVTMTEMLGALGQLVVVYCWLAWRQRPDARRARLFAVSLTALFFVKYNYLVLVAVPLALHEWLERTSGWTPARRLASLWGCTRRILSSPTGLFLLAYLAALQIVASTGGFQLEVLGQRVSVRGVGNSGLVVLYILLLRLWYLHRRGRVDWRRLTSADPRVRPLLLWFVLPVAVWLASPYPNHVRDFANLVINRPLGEPTVGSGIATYLEALRTDYFYSEWILAIVVGAFGVAAVRYRAQPPLMQWLVLAVPLQCAAIGLHQTRVPRFLLLTVVLLCLAAAGEIGRWFAGSRAARAVAGLLAPIALASGVMAAGRVVMDERFTAAAFDHYTDSGPLRAALDSIRAELGAGDRLLVVGQNNEISPALFRWELGPPSGVACFPFQIGGAGRLDPALATRVLLLVPLDSRAAPLDLQHNDPARLQAIEGDVDRGALVLRHVFPLPDRRVALRLYVRTSPVPRTVECEV